MTELMDAWKGSVPGIWGFGSYFGSPPRALVLLDETYAAVEFDAHESAAELDVEDRMMNLSDVIILRPELSEALALRSIRVKEPLVLAVGIPEPLALVGDLLRAPAATGAHGTTYTRGTIGFPVQRTDAAGAVHDGILTAGHCAPNGVGTTVDHVTTSRPSHTYSLLGTVEVHANPGVSPGSVSAPGADVAVVDLDANQPSVAKTHMGVARLPATTTPLAVQMVGGVSGLTSGGIIGSLMTVGPPHCQWDHCWLAVPGFAAQGDSGAAVLTDTQNPEAVGTLVGGSRMAGSSAYAVHFVQDLDSVDRNFLQAQDVSV